MFSLEDFLNLTDENKERFKEIILDHIDENEDIRKGVSTELLEESLKSIKNLKWSIDSEKLSIYWDQYEIAIGATGNIQLSIPLGEINFLLTDKAKKICINQTLKKIMYIKWLSNNLENSSILMENI